MPVMSGLDLLKTIRVHLAVRLWDAMPGAKRDRVR